jgi:hypothetical protein
MSFLLFPEDEESERKFSFGDSLYSRSSNNDFSILQSAIASDIIDYINLVDKGFFLLFFLRNGWLLESLFAVFAWRSPYIIDVQSRPNFS